MSGLDNRVWINGGSAIDDFKTKVSDFWNKHKKWIIIGLICLVVAAIVIAIIVAVTGKKKNKSSDEAESFTPHESFVTNDSIGENGFVNSYIKSSIGDFA